MKFLAIIEITPETMTVTLDGASVIDTQGSTLPHKTWVDLFAEYPKQSFEEVVKMWEEITSNRDARERFTRNGSSKIS